MAPLTALGAVAASDPAAVAAACPIVFLCLTDAEAIRAVLLGERGVATVAGPSTLIVDHSTVSPAQARAIAADLHDACGARFVDAPVTGGTPGAQARRLVVFGGGEPTDIERARPLVAHSSQRFAHMGPVGAGQATKMCNQVLVLNTFAVLAETVKLGEALGLDAAQLPETLAGGSADSRVLQVAGANAGRRDDTLTASISVQRKDLEILLALGAETGTPMPMTGAAAQLVRIAMARGLGETDASQLVRLYD